MKIAILDSHLSIESYLLEYFSKYQHFSCLLSENEILKELPLSFQPPQLTRDTRYDCFIFNIQAIETLEKALEIIFQIYEGSLWRPKVILISNLLSWSGKRYHVPVGGSLSEFTSRVPTSRDLETYKIENKFHSCATLTGMDMHIVSSGLIYGGRGFDFHQLFQALWEANAETATSLFSTVNGKNHLPMIHFRDLVEIIGHITVNKTTAFFIPATDGCTSALTQIAEQLSLVSKRTVLVMNKEDAIHHVLSSEEGEMIPLICPHRLWNQDITFSDSARIFEGVHLRYPNGMVDFITDVWKEYVSACATEPCSILIAGPPCSLKTTLAKELANRLQVAYVDPIDAMKFIVEKEDPRDTTDRIGSARATDLSHTLDLAQIAEPSVALKIELGRIITVQINGEKKKGKNLDETPIDLKTVTWTPNLVAAIPSDLIRRCVKLKLLEDTICARVGYVLDLWGHIQELEHVYEVTGTVPNMEDAATRRIISQQQSFYLEGFESLSPNSKGSLSPRPNGQSSSKLEGVAQKLPQLIIELESPDNVTLERALASLGCDIGGKPTKDQQAIVKDLETKLNQYSTKYKERTTSDGSSGKTHSVVALLEDLGYNIRRMNVGHLNGRGDGDPLERNRASISELFNKIYEEYVSLYGPLPWLGCSDERPVQLPQEEYFNAALPASQILSKYDSLQGEPTLQSQSTLNQLNLMNEHMRLKAFENAKNLENYLVENVLSHIAEAMVVISREKMKDPVLYLADFLYHRGVAVQEQETTAAYEKYLTAVQQAEEMEEEAAAQLLAISKRKM